MDPGAAQIPATIHLDMPLVTSRPQCIPIDTSRYLVIAAAVPFKGAGLNFNATQRSLSDSYWPAFGALLESSGRAPADGVMMAMAALNGISTTTSPLLLQVCLPACPPARPPACLPATLPACLSVPCLRAYMFVYLFVYLLQTMLRDTWHSDAIVQTDCCDSVTWTYNFMRHRHPNSNYTQGEAIAAFIAMGGGAYFGFDGNTYKPLVEAGVANGTNASHTWIPRQQIIAIGARVLETQMKLGAYFIVLEATRFSAAFSSVANNYLSHVATGAQDFSISIAMITLLPITLRPFPGTCSMARATVPSQQKQRRRAQSC
jgi:hypothetical protein